MSALAMILTAAVVVSDGGQPKELGEMVQESKPTLQIRQYPKDGQPWNRGEAILIRLDIDRLRAYDLSSEDVMKALQESGVVGSGRRVDPPPGVVFVTRLHGPKRYENVIVRANAEGEVVRLKDVAKIEVGR
jgi:multidrug efflux pump subunit AcrB